MNRHRVPQTILNKNLFFSNCPQIKEESEVDYLGELSVHKIQFGENVEYS
jgi:hypothetical protein